MARTMQDLSEAVFINMANFTLARRDSYLDYLHAGVKQDTVNALRTSPVHLDTLFPDQLVSRAEEEINKSEERRSSGTSHRHQGRFHPYSASDRSSSQHTDKKNVPAWKQIKDKQQARRGRGKASNFYQKPAKGSKSFCDWSGELCSFNRSGRLGPGTSDYRNQQSDFKFDCKLRCCKCSYCVRVATKERRKLVFSIFPVIWDRVGSNFNGRVPGYSFRWAIIGITTKISTFEDLKPT